MISASVAKETSPRKVKGKKASDSAMVIDSEDMLYSGKVSGFCPVTSDSDVTKLAIRLREAGMLSKRVPGINTKKYGYKKLKDFVESFDRFDIQEIPHSGNELLKKVYIKVK